MIKVTRTYIRPGSPAFTDLFDDFTGEAFRLETLQAYSEPEEDGPRRQFEAGEPVGDDPGTLEWVKWLIAGRAAGKSVARVHILTTPISEYARFELAYYRPGLSAGEDIRIIPVAAGEWPAGLPEPGGDFWLFRDTDGKGRVVHMEYSKDGAFTGAWLTTDPAEVAQAVGWRDTAMADAIPLAEYTTTLPLAS
jgi:hypothetical protein